MVRITRKERRDFEYAIRYERICAKDALDFTQEGRNIGRLMMFNSQGLSIREISAATGLGRPLVKRRIDRMAEVDAVILSGEKYKLSERGVHIWLLLHREIDKVARGRQKRFSPHVLRLLRLWGLHSEKQLKRLCQITYPRLR